MIDVSLPHKKDTSINHVFDNLSKAISRFTMTQGDNSLEFNSYSLQFLIEDLEKILFHVAEFPWNDNKYAKRLNRLCYLYFLDSFVKQTNNIDRSKLVKNTLYEINKVNTVPLTGNSPDESVSELDRLTWYFHYVKLKAGDKFGNELNTFKQNIERNLKELGNGFSSIDEYCKMGPGN